MKMVSVSIIARSTAAAAIALMGAYTPLQAQSQSAVCLRSATATCNISIEGYTSYSQCVSRERQECLDGIPEDPGPDRPPCKPNDFSCGL
jgi:hypothetical protein